MLKHTQFADQEREATLNELGDRLRLLSSMATSRRWPHRSLRPRYALSDDQMEFQLPDRLGVQRFVGLRHGSQIPHRITVWTFKERLIEAGASGVHTRM